MIHGISEADKGTARQVRSKHDHEKVVTTLKKLDSDISPHYIRDCFRLGKYNESKHRPILVKLTSSNDVSSIKQKGTSKTREHCHPNFRDRKILLILLKERKKLIEDGVERKYIKIRGTTISVQGILFGTTDGNIFTYAQDQTRDNSSPPQEELTSAVTASQTQPPPQPKSSDTTPSLDSQK